MPDPKQIVHALAQIVGSEHIIRGDAGTTRLARYTEELRGRFSSQCHAVVLPENAAEVAAVVKYCAAGSISVVPQGGNTGTVGGSVARDGQIIVNLARMNRVLDLDPKNHTMRVQAGCVLAELQTAARNAQRLFPLSLSAEGSCQIGGNLATNAGGINVLRYGNARDLVLGLEVVLADGQIWSDMNALRKNNSGYDLKHLFIGSEGTLGIITAAVLKLFPLPQHRVVALAGVARVDTAVALLAALRRGLDERISTFELISDFAVQSACKHLSGQRNPLPQRAPWYVLLVAESSSDFEDREFLTQRVAHCLSGFSDQGVTDASIAQNQAQCAGLLKLRENIVEAQKYEGASIKHDIAVPVSAVPEFLRRAEKLVAQVIPGARPFAFGHIGDGNIHYNISQPVDATAQDFFAQREAINAAVHDLALQLGGSFSAEHGIGIAKLDAMARYKNPLSLALYRRIKDALDPANVFNPGKMLPESADFSQKTRPNKPNKS